MQAEPALCVVSDPMKSVTKLGRASAPPLPPLLPPLPGFGGEMNGGDVLCLKRKYVGYPLPGCGLRCGTGGLKIGALDSGLEARVEGWGLRG